MVASLMDWAHIRHVPVEDAQNRLVGLVSYRSLLRLMARGWKPSDGSATPVSEIMRRDLVTAETKRAGPAGSALPVPF